MESSSKSNSNSSGEEEQLDRMLLAFAQQVSQLNGSTEIDGLLDAMFGFLRRRTDFFSGASSDKDIEDALLKSCRNQMVCCFFIVILLLYCFIVL